MPQEVSAVYKGAVPGAGFRKVLALSRVGGLNESEAGEARESYAELLESDDRTIGPRARAAQLGGNMDILRAFRFWQAAGEPAEINLESLAATPAEAPARPSGPATAEDPEKVLLRLRVAELEELARGAEARGLRQQADAFIHAEVSAGRVVPAETERLIEVYVQSGLDDAERPLKAIVGHGEFTRLAYFKRGIQARKPHSLMKEEIGAGPVLPAGSRPLASGAEPPDPRAPMKPERLAEMLAATPQGRPVLAALAKGS
jgi:hypothetical protein